MPDVELAAPSGRSGDGAAGAVAPHELTPDVVALPSSVVIALATSAPGQSTALALASMVAAAAYATGPAIVISMLAMLSIAYSYQRLNLWQQNCGGPYVWAGRAISPYLGYMIGWSMLVGFLLGSVSDILPLGPSLLSLVGLDVSGVAGNVLTATVFGAVMTALAALGLRLTARFQVTIAAVEYLILAVLSGVAFWAVFIGHWPGTVHPTVAWLSPRGVGGKGSLAASLLIGVFLFTGWDAAAYINEETTQKRTNPGRAVMIAVALLGPIYVWLFVSFQGVVSGPRLAAHQADALPYLAGVLLGGVGTKLMVLAIILSVIGTTQATLVAASRVSYSMGTDGLLPRRVGRVHPRLGTPAFAAVCWGVVMIAVADLYVVSTSLANVFNDVVNSLGVAVSIFYIGAAVSMVAYYRRLVLTSARHVLTIGVVPLAGAGVLAWVLAKDIPTFTATARIYLAGVVLVGLVAMAVSARVLRAPYFATPRSAYVPGDEDREVG
ncbi:MAG TPA: APC family permease [Acidimicrobiales bacterium]|nr:APC family permease [Acidimicrobiales bacterium]